MAGSALEVSVWFAENILTAHKTKLGAVSNSSLGPLAVFLLVFPFNGFRVASHVRAWGLGAYRVWGVCGPPARCP